MSSLTTITPSIFIGSSTEGRDVARAIESNLHEDAEITLWSHGVFGLNTGYLESLVSALDKFDYAVLVLTPDDLVSSRETVSQAPRDNVMFELGLFMGRLGRNRTFALRSSEPSLKLPSDLAGVNILSFNSSRTDGNLAAALSPACSEIRKCVRELGVSETRVVKRLVAATKLFEGVSNQTERIVHLMARSRILELEIIQRQFGGFLAEDLHSQLLDDLRRLRGETEPAQ